MSDGGASLDPRVLTDACGMSLRILTNAGFLSNKRRLESYNIICAKNNTKCSGKSEAPSKHDISHKLKIFYLLKVTLF